MSGNARRAATPLVAQLAARMGVDLTNVVGTGVAGRIRSSDVQDAAARRTAPDPYQDSRTPLPAFTASGIDPALLTSLPGPARAAAAAASTPAEAHRILRAYAGTDDFEALRSLARDPKVPSSVVANWLAHNDLDAHLTQGQTLTVVHRPGEASAIWPTD